MSYAGSKAQGGLGGALSIGAVSGSTGTETFTLVGEAMDAPLKFGAWQTAGVTNFQSTTEEKVPIIQGVGTCDIKFNRVSTDAGQVLMLAAYQSGLAYDFKLVLPINGKAGQTTAGDVYTFSAYVLSFVFDSIDPTKIITATANLQLVGKPAFTAGS